MKKKVLVSSAAAAMLLSVLAPNYVSAVNPYLPLWEHIPDGEPRVFEDPDNPGKYRIYIIGSHDVRFDSYCGPDIHVWSAPIEDLSDWRDEGSVFTFEDTARGQWDVMYAPDLVEVLRRDENGERTIREYYLYPHSRGPGREPMVAKSDRPDGPFVPINLNSDGRTVKSGSIMGFDPSVYIEYVDDPNDPDYDIGFRAYGYWGFMKSHAAQLDQETMYSLRPGEKVIQFFIPASNSYGDIRDPEGTEYPHVAEGEDLGTFNFFEAASIRKVGNKYVWVYSGYSGPDYGLGSSNATLRYAFGDSPLGPWRSGGVLIDARAVVANPGGTALMTAYSGHNTHGSIELIGDQWYVFYHRAPRGFGNARQAMVAPVHITYDEKSVADGGTVTIRAWNPGNVPSTVIAGDREYTGAEVTSEGFHIYGLDPFRYYSAGIACYLSNHGLQADAWDIWDDHAPITGMKDGDVVGYKYFGFGGLKEDTKGLKAFEGTGRNMKLNLFLLLKTRAEFKISVWLDSPTDVNGTKIGELTVPAAQVMGTVAQYTLDVSSYTEGLTGKHALYLKAEGAGASFDLHGLGFTADGKEISKPPVPKIEITANGLALELPRHPVRSDDYNGITGYNYYEANCYLGEGVRVLPELVASADMPDVKIELTQADESGVATAVFDYRGAVKTYTINFIPHPTMKDPLLPPGSAEPPTPQATPDGNETASPPADAPASSPSSPGSNGDRQRNLLLPILGGAFGVTVVGALSYMLFKKRK